MSDDPNNPGDNISSLLSKHNAINDMYQRAEDALDGEIRGIDWRQMRPEVAAVEREYCEQMHQSIRQAVFIVLYSYLEAGMDLIGNRFVTDYRNEMAKEKKKGDGNFKARLRVFARSDIGFAPGQEEGDIAEALRLIRNCLVHAAGRMAQSREKQKLEDAIRRLQENGKKSNCQSIKVRNGQILLSDDVLPLANCTSHDLVWDLYKAAMRSKEDDRVNDGRSGTNPR
jgi:hypothetical protein